MTTESNPITSLKEKHLRGVKDATIHYTNIHISLNLFWATEYCKLNNIKLVRVKIKED